MNQAAPSSLLNGIREFFLLERAERRSSAFNASQRETIRALVDAANRRLPVARDLRGPSGAPVALTLYQQAGRFLAVALLVSKDAQLDPRALPHEEVVQKLEAVLAADGLAPSVELARVKPLLGSSDPLELDRLPTEEADQVAEDFESATRWLSRLVDPRSPKELKSLRFLRVAVGVACAIALLALLGRWAFSPKNLARGKPTASSSAPMFSTTSDGVVDGSKNGTYGFHSSLEDSPWLSIDLGRNYDIGRIKVYGRGDNVNDQSIPLALELSGDGSAYRQVATRNEPFSESEPWVIAPPPPLAARFIRLRTLRKSYLVLGEVEVFKR
jgi:F5/8 type C domain